MKEKEEETLHKGGKGMAHICLMNLPPTLRLEGGRLLGGYVKRRGAWCMRFNTSGRKSRKKFAHNCLEYLDDEQLTAKVRLFPFTVFLHGQEFRMSGVAGAPPERKSGGAVEGVA
jgi:hypothetical protein